MKPTETLIAEHRLIRQALDVMQTAVHNMEKAKNPPPEFFEKIIIFGREFVDKFHHFKEEHLMFGRLAQIEKGCIDPDVEMLRNQHERGREHINLIANALEGYREGNADKALTILENLTVFISLLRLHIHQEDHLFFPKCDKEFQDNDLDYLAELFKKEEEKFGTDMFSKNEELIKEIKSMV